MIKAIENKKNGVKTIYFRLEKIKKLKNSYLIFLINFFNINNSFFF